MEKKELCSYCHKPLRKRYFIGFSNSNTQCDRLLCRLKTGNWLWMTFHRRLVFEKVPLIPRLVKN